MDLPDSTSTLLSDLAAAELLAEEVLSQKHLLVELDRRRQKIREAGRNIRLDCPGVDSKSDKVWMTAAGGQFIRMSQKDALRQLNTDLETLEKEIDLARKCLRAKVNDLAALELQQTRRVANDESDFAVAGAQHTVHRATGFTLNPLTAADIASIKALF